MKRFLFAACALSTLSLMSGSRTFSGFLGGAGSGAISSGVKKRPEIVQRASMGRIPRQQFEILVSRFRGAA